MLFNSFEFLIFFVIVFGLYLILSHKWQNRLLVVASCIFYCFWSWKFLFLMLTSISTDFVCSRWMDKEEDPKRRKMFLLISIGVNLTILGFFKYYNFFIAHVQDVLRSLHLLNPSVEWTLNIILPLGISFYTFEAISYVVDVYNRKVKPAEHYWDYVLFVIYFPHLIAGPIMRAKQFLPQITTPRQLTLTQFYEGCHLFFWGLFEKVFIADNLAKIVNPIFAGQAPYDGSAVLIGVYAFSFQIFCDFDGYSNMARGLGKMMGFDITINFKWPYFVCNPREFWQHWHISLSSWLRDYLYIPLGGNRKGEARTYVNLILTMLLGGLWHGAAWTFVVWGAYHGALLVGQRLLEKVRSGKDSIMAAGLWTPFKMIIFFHFVAIGWLFFRATSLPQAMQMLSSLGGIKWEANLGDLFLKFFAIVWPLLLVQFGQYKSADHMFLFRLPRLIKIFVYAFMTYLIIGFGVMQAEEFIYFQF